MMKFLFFIACVTSVGMATPIATVSAATSALPNPIIDVEAGKSANTQTAVLAGGCFWGIEGVFKHVKGVTSVVSGYAGGRQETASYDQVSSGTTGHAESVRITYDPKQISYGQLLKIFFSVAHDPTELNRQGPDREHNIARQFSLAMKSRNAWRVPILSSYRRHMCLKHLSSLR